MAAIPSFSYLRTISGGERGYKSRDFDLLLPSLIQKAVFSTPYWRFLREVVLLAVSTDREGDV